MKRRHEFLDVGVLPYCAVCSLPRGNGIHRTRPRSFAVAVMTFTLDDPQRDCHYGPFGTEADAKEFAAKLVGPHRTATVTELSDPAQVVTTKK